MPSGVLQAPHSRRILSRLASGLQIAGEGVAELLWPTRCVLCDVPGTLLCDECRLEIPYIDPLRACPYCGQAHGRYACIDCNSFMLKHRGLFDEQPECATAPPLNAQQEFTMTPQHNKQPECALTPPLDRIASVFEFVDPCRKLITTYKDRKEIRLADVLAELLAAYIDPSWIEPGQTAIVVIPARKQAICERGFDHMQQIGERLSRLTNLPLLNLIAPQERGDQRGLSAAHRQKNMRNSFVPRGEGAWHPRTSAHICATAGFTRSVPRTIILVDDVLTTGATLNAAATVLKQMGVQQVLGLTLGRIP
ncbi:ComF family protein [Anaerotardibacter muris]|uniref:ComF family protein n=1 Tax=Anaerotardibacter muris TaxID=2941505 RepID=UPI00203C99EE|nr:hypothetical protein [Anaerotardibacter muris]